MALMLGPCLVQKPVVNRGFQFDTGLRYAESADQCRYPDHRITKRRPSVEALAQHHGLDTKALELLQDLRRVQLNILRSQVLTLGPQNV